MTLMKAYKLRPEYEGTLVGGTLNAGPDLGTLDIVEALQEGDGEIVTDNSVLQGALENYHGASGLVFEVFEVTGDDQKGREPLQEAAAAQLPDPSRAAAAAPGDPNKPPQPSPPMPPAVHGEGSEYEHFTAAELREVVDERGLEVPSRAKKEELIAALEADDQKGQTVDEVS